MDVSFLLGWMSHFFGPFARFVGAELLNAAVADVYLIALCNSFKTHFVSISSLTCMLYIYTDNFA